MITTLPWLGQPLLATGQGFDTLLLQVLLQLVVIISAARLGARLFVKLGQPEVVGEIVTGLVLGPSVVGRWLPEVSAVVFSADTAVIFHVFSELGLILLMFLIGLEFDFSHFRRIGKSAAAVALSGIVAPFGLGVGLALWIQPLVAPEVDAVGFALIVGIAMSITAIPILGRLMIELDIHRTPLGTLTISAAAIDDALGWILLAGVSALIRGESQWQSILRMLVLTAIFVVVCWYLGRRLMRHIDRGICPNTQELSLSAFAFVLVGVFLSATATSAIGIFSIFGPFVLGAALSDQRMLRSAIVRELRHTVYALFLPVFFTYTGLRTNIGLLNTWQDWAICGIVFAVATVGKLGGCGVAAVLSGNSLRDSTCIALMMNTRALMGLIAINAGRDMGVVSDRAFCMLVIMALATTLMTTPLLRRALPQAVRQHQHQLVESAAT